MSLCKGNLFFFRNPAILGAGLKTSFANVSKITSNSNIRNLNYLKKGIFNNDKANIINNNNNTNNQFVKSPLLKNLSGSKKLFSTFQTGKRFFSSSVPKFSSTSIPLSNNSKWPANSHKSVGYLCIGTSILVFAIVVLGGLTRLTESGLSITEWKPVTGALPPLSEEDWIEEFDKYKESPEFKQLNSNMELEDFKFIYSMEWSHRLLGRIIGTVFVLPTLYLVARKRVSIKTAGKLLGICGLIGLQGAIGWWMVYSGIDTDLLEERRSKPTVSQYRLAAHLGAAFVVYCAMISTGFSVLRNQWIMKDPESWSKYFQQIESKSLLKFKNLSKGLFGLVFLTAMSGAFVAGLDAGLIYNTFPHMGENYIPNMNELFDPVYSRVKDQTDLWWRNLLENQATVQLEHRILATTTCISVFALHMYSHKIKTIIPRHAYKWLNISMGVVTLQYILGMCTLLYLVPTDLAAAHQAGALTLLTTTLLLVNNLKKPSTANKIILKKFLEDASKKAGKPLK